MGLSERNKLKQNCITKKCITSLLLRKNYSCVEIKEDIKVGAGGMIG
jgi:hypothetical protein